MRASMFRQAAVPSPQLGTSDGWLQIEYPQPVTHLLIILDCDILRILDCDIIRRSSFSTPSRPSTPTPHLLSWRESGGLVGGVMPICVSGGAVKLPLLSSARPDVLQIQLPNQQPSHTLPPSPHTQADALPARGPPAAAAAQQRRVCHTAGGGASKLKESFAVFARLCPQCCKPEPALDSHRGNTVGHLTCGRACCLCRPLAARISPPPAALRRPTSNFCTITTC